MLKNCPVDGPRPVGLKTRSPNLIIENKIHLKIPCIYKFYSGFQQ